MSSIPKGSSRTDAPRTPRPTSQRPWIRARRTGHGSQARPGKQPQRAPLGVVIALQRPRAHHDSAGECQSLSALIDEPRLSHPGIATDHETSAAALERLFEERKRRCVGVRPAHERRIEVFHLGRCAAPLPRTYAFRESLQLLARVLSHVFPEPLAELVIDGKGSRGIARQRRRPHQQARRYLRRGVEHQRPPSRFTSSVKSVFSERRLALLEQRLHTRRSELAALGRSPILERGRVAQSEALQEVSLG
jgi:hypothetical protein